MTRAGASRAGASAGSSLLGEEPGRLPRPGKAAAHAIGRVIRGRAGRPQDGRTVVLHLPYVTARLEMAPPPADTNHRLGPVVIPSAKMTAYYVGLGTLAAVEAIEWPIAAAIAAGSYVAEHTRSAATGRGDGARH